MKPVLLLDMDGPLADFETHYVRIVRELGVELNINDPFAPRTKRFLEDHMPSKQDRKRMRMMVTRGDWFRQLPVTPGALEGVPELMALYDVWVCTKPLEENERCRDDKAWWLRQYFPELEDRLIIAPDKGRISGDALLDDAPKLKWIERGVDWEPVIFPAPFNGPNSVWGDYRTWTWGDPPELLILDY